MKTFPRPYKEVSAEVDAIADRLGLPIDLGIKKVVTALRVWRFPTSGSCEGHMGRGAFYPWVEIYAPDQPEQAWKIANKLERERLITMLEEYYATTDSPYRFEFDEIGIFGGFRLVPQHHTKVNAYSEQEAKSSLRKFDSFADFLIEKAG